jgi:retinol dehydrogenase-12
MKFTARDFFRTQWARIPPVNPEMVIGKVVVVVGANTGIGFEIAQHFARKQPAKLILACRDRAKGEAALQSEWAALRNGYLRPDLSAV